MRTFTLTFWLVFCGVGATVCAQQEVNYALYRYHLNLINPAAAGTQGAPFLNLGIRNQWLGVEDAPSYYWINAQGEVQQETATAAEMQLALLAHPHSKTKGP